MARADGDDGTAHTEQRDGQEERGEVRGQPAEHERQPDDEYADAKRAPNAQPIDERAERVRRADVYKLPGSEHQPHLAVGHVKVLDDGAYERRNGAGGDTKRDVEQPHQGQHQPAERAGAGHKAGGLGRTTHRTRRQDCKFNSICRILGIMHRSIPR